MERIKLITFSILIMCTSIFISSFFYLSPLTHEEVYEHMNIQIQDVLQVINLPSDTSILSQEEFMQPLSSEDLTKRVQELFKDLETDSLYSYDEETITEISTSIKTIYEKERERIDQGDAKKAVSMIKGMSISAIIVTFGILFILRKKKKTNKKEGNDKEDSKL